MTTREKRVIFHVGAEATGTWLLQRYIAEHTTSLRALGVHAASQQTLSKVVRWGKLAADPDRFGAAVTRALADDVTTYLASQESVIGDAFDAAAPQTGGLYPAARTGLAALAQAARPFRSHVILTVRPQAEFLEAYYVRMVNAGGTEPFEDWLANRDLDNLSWQPLHQTLLDTFGPAAVRVVNFSYPGVREAVDLQAFFAAAEIDPPEPLGDQPVVGRGMSERAMGIALAANPYLTSYDERAGLRTLLQKNFSEGAFPPPVLLSDAQRADLTQRYSVEYDALVAATPSEGVGQ